MNVLITAGNTLTPIDRVRCITNIFSGRTGAQIALAAHAHGHDVTLVTSHPEAVATLCNPPPGERWAVKPYRTFEDLERLMAAGIAGHTPDAVVHCAAVSDYRSVGIFAAAAGTRFDLETGRWHSDAPSVPRLEDRAAAKVKSSEPELWLRLVRTPKLADRIRGEWGFRGVLVKFKLEVEVSDEALLHAAERSRLQSSADLMVANSLEDMQAWAFLGPVNGRYDKVARRELGERLVVEIERLV